MGDDTLYGDDGQDTLIGGAGDDTLDGGFDKYVDTLYGDDSYNTYAQGHDTFVEHLQIIGTLPLVDTIVDMNHNGVSDKVKF